MTAEMIAPEWMRRPITAEQYDSWSEEQCRGIEIENGMVRVSPSASLPHNRTARMLANVLDAASSDWNADLDFDVRLQDVPLINRRPDIVVYRADSIDRMPMRPTNVLMIVEIVSPGSEATDRKVKPDEYAKAGVMYYWRVEQVGFGVPVVHTHVLDPAGGVYRVTEVFTGLVDAVAPFPVKIDLRAI